MLNKFGDKSLDKKLLRKIIKEIKKREIPEFGEIDIVFMDDLEIAGLNERFFKRQGPTDVISFNLGKEDFESEKDLMGEIYISFERAVEQAMEQEIPIKEEVVKLLIHGVLHLMGYDHENESDSEKMRKKEDFYRSLFCEGNYSN
jgi:rRNA maturation RNase YbeY